jgi:hypothetical protein
MLTRGIAHQTSRKILSGIAVPYQRLCDVEHATPFAHPSGEVSLSEVSQLIRIAQASARGSAAQQSDPESVAAIYDRLSQSSSMVEKPLLPEAELSKLAIISVHKEQVAIDGDSSWMLFHDGIGASERCCVTQHVVAAQEHVVVCADAFSEPA